MEVVITPDDWFEFEEKEPPSWEDTAPSEYEPPDNKYAPPERRAELEAEMAEQPPRPEEEVAEWFEDKKPEPKKEEEKTIHEKMYEMATARYNPFSLGGSENCDSDISCNNIGGSENLTRS